MNSEKREAWEWLWLAFAFALGVAALYFGLTGPPSNGSEPTGMRWPFRVVQEEVLETSSLSRGRTQKPLRINALDTHRPLGIPGRMVAEPVERAQLRLDVEGLLFLLETDDRQFPFTLMIEQNRFDVAVQALNERSRLHIDELQPRLTLNGVKRAPSAHRPQ